MTKEIIYGLHTIETLLTKTTTQCAEIWVQSGLDSPRITQVLAEAKAKGIKVSAVTKERLDSMCRDQNHQGVTAAVAAFNYYYEAELASLYKNLTSPLILALDSVQDPHNLGAIIRTAEAMGVQLLLIPKDKSATVTPLVRKIACGAAELLPIVQVTNLVRSLKTLQQLGAWIYGAESSGENTQSLFEVKLSGAIVWVVGAEGKGARRLVREVCDHLINIPLVGETASLNVSVATAVCLAETRRQLQN